MGHFEDYEHFLVELDKVWRECRRVLVGGGRICCVVGDVCIPRKKGGRHYLVPLHSDIQVRARKAGLDCLQPIFWHKIANGATEAEGNGAGFYGKPYQPGGIIKNDVEYILFLRKGGEYRSVPHLQKALSMLSREEMRQWQCSIWTDLRGASTRDGHPAPFPVELAERLIKMFSFAGDTVLRHRFHVAGCYHGRQKFDSQRDRAGLRRDSARPDQARRARGPLSWRD
jgi:site-specific DNA-methyltransferase (adenine-specific)